MNSDIRLSVGVRTHPKPKKLRRRLGAEGVLAWIYLLTFTGSDRSSGVLTSMDAEDIAIASQWEGNPEEFVQVLIDLNLLDRTDDGTLAIHDWEDHNPWAANAEARSEKARKAANAKWDRRLGKASDAPSNANPCSEHCSAQDQAEPQAQSSNTPSPSPSPNPSPTPMGRKATPAPDSMEITDQMRAWAAKNGFEFDLEDETKLFLDDRAAKGATYIDWGRAWQSWIRREAKYRRQRGGNSKGDPEVCEAAFRGGI